MLRTLGCLTLLTCVSTASANFITNKIQGSKNRSLLSSFSPMTVDERILPPEVSRKNPGYVHILLDKSGSMDQLSGSSGKSKAQAISDHTNAFVRSLISRLTDLDSSDGTVKPYFDISIRAYSDPFPSGDLRQSISLLDFLGGQDWSSIVEVAKRAQNGVVAELREPPVWARLHPDGQTNTAQAMAETHRIVQAWAEQHPQSHPPIVAHLTDGFYNTGDPAPFMKDIRDVSTEKGNAILLNAFISDSSSDAVLFPSMWHHYRGELQTLFNQSSVIPPWWVEPLRNMGFDASPTSRAFMHNGSIEDFHNVIEMGTRAAMGASSGRN